MTEDVHVDALSEAIIALTGILAESAALRKVIDVPIRVEIPSKIRGGQIPLHRIRRAN